MTKNQSISTVPDWRVNAPAGVPLAAVAPQPMGVAQSDGAMALQRILRPEVATRWSGWLARDYTPDRIEQALRGALMGDHGAAWEVFHLMEDTWPRLQKALGELKRAVLQYDWCVEPWTEEGQPPTPQAEERAKLVSRAVWTMAPRADEAANGFEATLFDLLDAWGKGTSVLEVDWEVRGGEFAPKQTHWVHPRCYAWTDEGRIALRLEPQSSVASRPRAGDLVEFPPHKFLIGICRARTGPVLSTALLRPLAWWWCAANFSASWILNLAQIFGLPIRWATYAQGTSPTMINQICAMLENMGSAAWAAFPSGTQIELKEPTKGGGSWPQDALLDRADRQVDLLVLGQTLTTDVGDSGSRALGGVHKSVRDEIVASAASWLASIVNQQLVRSILLLNYGDDGDAPEFCPKPVETQDLKANAERDAVLLDRGIALPKEWFYRRHQIPIPQEGEELISKPAAATPPAGGSEPAGETPEAPEDAEDPEEEDPNDPQAGMDARALYARSAAQRDLADAVLADVTKVQAEWLGGARPWFQRLIAAAGDPGITDTEFMQMVARARAAVPEQLGPLLTPDAVADALEKAMGASCINGAIAGHLRRSSKNPPQNTQSQRGR